MVAHMKRKQIQTEDSRWNLYGQYVVEQDWDVGLTVKFLFTRYHCIRALLFISEHVQMGSPFSKLLKFVKMK